MLAREREFQRKVQQLIDAAVFGAALWAAHWIRLHWRIEVFGGKAEILPFMEYYSWLWLFVVPGGPFLLHVYGFYNRPVLASRRQTVWIAAKSVFVLTASLSFLLWVARVGPQVGRSVVILFGPVSFVMLLLKEEAVRRWRKAGATAGQLKKSLLLVGTPAETARMREHLRGGGEDHLEVAAELNLNEEPMERLVELLHRHSANAVILSGERTLFGKMEEAIAVCEREGVEVWLVADFFKTRVSQTYVDSLYGRPMLVFRSAPDTSWPVVIKRGIDFVGSAALLVLLGPVMLATAVAIKLTSPGPILFRQRRAGINGRPFTMLKFRSMVTDAEQRRHELEVFNEMKGPVFKVSNDPRVTPIGRFLRRYSIDELPQLINVLRGEMSLVGPRPLPVDEVSRFDNPAHRRRLSVKPGLTCLWQISGRNEVRDFDRWVQLDLEYIDNWSLWLDFKILVRTVPVVLSGQGAK